MSSLLERMSIPSNSSGGPIRSRTPRGGANPYNRAHRPPKGDVDSPWSHDLYEDPTSAKPPSLSARLNSQPAAPRPHLNFSIAQKAVREATSHASDSNQQLSIKGASTAGNVVEVTGLVNGTTPEDVSAIFKRCGTITSAKIVPSTPQTDGVTIRVTFKAPASATAAVQKFHNQPADGKTLNVKIVGGASTTLGGRLGGSDGLGLVREEGSVDVLMEGTEDTGGSKMRSDSLLRVDPRAHVLLAPPGADPADYVSTPTGPRRGPRGRGGRRGIGRGGRNGRMDIDR